MAIGERLQSLRRKHAELEERIREASLHASAYQAEIKRLKLQKLRLKEEMERLSRSASGSRDSPAMATGRSPATMDGMAAPLPDDAPPGGLRRRHAELDERIRAAYQRPVVDEAEVRRLKLEKLHLKEMLEGIAAPSM